MKNSYMNNEKCSGVEILYNLSFFRSQFQNSHSQLLFFNVRFVLLPIRKITDCVHLLLLRQMMREF